jgi:hypothetical protein
MSMRAALGAAFNLNQPAHYVHWHFFQMSVANVSVIVAMLIVFALAILLPFPGARRRAADRRAAERGSATGGGATGEGATGGRAA